MLSLVILALAFVPGTSAETTADPPVFLMKWGTQGSAAGQFNDPTGMGIDSDGNIYVADRGNSRIQKFTGDGVLLGAWGSAGTDPGQFYAPLDVAISPTTGEIYVSEPAVPRVQVFSPDFKFLRAFPIAAYSLSIDPSGVYLYATVYPGNMRKYAALDGAFVREWTYSFHPSFPVFSFATDGDENVYVSDLPLDRVCKYSDSGVETLCWGRSGTGDDMFYSPGPVGLDESRGIVYVVDAIAAQEFTPAGVYLTKFGSRGAGDGQFAGVPEDVVVDSRGFVFILDNNLTRVQKFGSVQTPTIHQTWGRLKALYR